VIARLSRRLHRDRRGVTVVEFAMVAPVMLGLIMGLGDIMYQAYVQAILDGAMQKAGRDSALENNIVAGDTIDDVVEARVKEIAKNARFESDRKSYTSFALIKPEYIYDKNGNGKLDSKECYDDVNANGTWDKDPGRDSQGSADDVTLYTMSVTYPRLFPVAGLFGFDDEQTVTSKTLLKNQPYKAQTTYTIKKVCLP
jgi:Flp pilus assembly protein TadG